MCCVKYRTSTCDKLCSKSCWLTIRTADPQPLCAKLAHQHSRIKCRVIAGLLPLPSCKMYVSLALVKLTGAAFCLPPEICKLLIHIDVWTVRCIQALSGSEVSCSGEQEPSHLSITCQLPRPLRVLWTAQMPQ